MLAVREDLARKMVEIAGPKRSLYDFVNEVLRQVVRVDDMGLTLKDVVDGYGALETARKAGFTLVAERLWREIVDWAFAKGKRWMIRKWYDTGEWYAKFYSAKEPEDPLKAFERARIRRQTVVVAVDWVAVAEMFNVEAGNLAI